MIYNRTKANSPRDKAEQIGIVVHPETLRKFQDGHFNAKIGEYCGILYGDGAGMLFAQRLWQGLRRPFNKTLNEEDIFIYMFRPACTFTYADELEGSPTKVEAPRNAVFLAFVELQSSNAEGTLLNWEWVLADDDQLPENHQQRFMKPIW